MIIIAKNNTVQDIVLGDLFGIKVPAAGQINLSERIDDYALIADSQELKDAIINGNIIFNNGTIDFGVADALDALNFPTFYDLSDQVANSPGISSGKDILITFSGDDDGEAHTEIECTSWQTVAIFPFTGTIRMGLPSKVHFVAEMKHSSYNGDLRIYDSTNNNTIAQVNNFTNTVPQIHTDSSLINLPTDLALFEIQGKTSSNEKDLYLYSCLIQF